MCVRFLKFNAKQRLHVFNSFLKITQIDIPGPVGRRIERRLSANTRLDMVSSNYTVHSFDEISGTRALPRIFFFIIILIFNIFL